MSSKTIRWGILGTSPIAQTMVQAIRESDQGEVVAVAGRSLAKAEDFARTHAIPTFYHDYTALLEDVSIDVVYIGLPNHLHKEWIIRCAQAGKHILCEKPFVTNLQDAQEALVAVKKANVFFMEALMYRCHPFTKKLHELLQNKTIGDIRLINAVYTANIAALANTTAGGSILHLGCYPISLMRLLAGSHRHHYTAEPFEVVSLGEMDNKRNNDHRAAAILRFPHQIIGTVLIADDTEMQAGFDVYGSEGCLKVVTNPWLPQRENKIIIQRNDQVQPMEVFVTADKSTYAYQIDVVNQHILNGQTIVDGGGVSWFDSLGNVVVLEAWLKQVKKVKEEVINSA